MKNLARTIIVLCAVLFAATAASAQVGNTPHKSKSIKHIFVNHEEVTIFIGPHSDSKEKSGLSGWSEIKPGESIALEVRPDSVSRMYKGKLKTSAKLAFRITTDPTSIEGENYMIPFSKLKTTIHIAETQVEADGFSVDKTKERGVAFNSGKALDENEVICYLVNESSVSISFSDPNHPFYGKTLGPKTSIGMNSSERSLLVSTGFKTSEILVIRETGKEPIRLVRTLPILESSTEVILTDEFFDLSTRENSKFYPFKLKLLSPVDVTITGAFDKSGNEVVYVIPAGPEGAKGKIIWLKYGENPINLNYDYKGELPQALIIRADERGSKTLKFQTKGALKGRFVLDV